MHSNDDNLLEASQRYKETRSEHAVKLVVAGQ